MAITDDNTDIDTEGMVSQTQTPPDPVWVVPGTGWMRDQSPLLSLGIGTVVLLVLATLAMYLVRTVITPLVRKLVGRTRIRWDDALLNHAVFHRASWFIPALVTYYGRVALGGLVYDPSDAAILSLVLGNVALATMVITGMRTLCALLAAVNQIYNRLEIAKNRPIKGYIQIIKIFIYVVGGVVSFAILINESPVIFLSGIGAMTAVLLLVFKDTILSLVASIQLSSNDMLRVGDWLEMPACGADGDVIDIALHTVKVQNWDKTITTIPTHRLISESFKNWRGMQDVGGRRICRNLNIDLSTIRFLDQDEIARYQRWVLLHDYMTDKLAELDTYNTANNPGGDLIPNARRLTNIGTFRAYVVNYLRHKNEIRQDLTFLVRQLQPTENGLPIQVYVFANTTVWAEYEDIQADVFDHLLSIVDEFGLRVFQRPSGSDITALATFKDGA